MRAFLIFLLVIPILELTIFLILGNYFGIAETLLMIIGTGIIGGILMKKQGLKVVQNVQQQIQNGVMPGDAIINGLSVLIGSILLLFPGFITDIVGVLILIPITRKLFKALLIRYLHRAIQKRNRVTIIHR